MNRAVILVLVMVVVGALGAVPNRTGVAASSAADPAVLVKADQDFDAATAARGQEGFSSFIASDMTTIQPDEAIVRGKEGFVEGWKAVFSTPGLAVRWQPQLARISDDATLGFTVGNYTTTRTENGSARTVGSGKYVTIWRKQADGSWRVTFDSGVHDTPPASPAKP
jgi:ketosteroid isomerase-like protein